MGPSVESSGAVAIRTYHFPVEELIRSPRTVVEGNLALVDSICSPRLSCPYFIFVKFSHKISQQHTIAEVKHGVFHSRNKARERVRAYSMSFGNKKNSGHYLGHPCVIGKDLKSKYGYGRVMKGGVEMDIQDSFIYITTNKKSTTIFYHDEHSLGLEYTL